MTPVLGEILKIVPEARSINQSSRQTHLNSKSLVRGFSKVFLALEWSPLSQFEASIFFDLAGTLEVLILAFESIPTGCQGVGIVHSSRVADFPNHVSMRYVK